MNNKLLLWAAPVLCGLVACHKAESIPAGTMPDGTGWTDIRFELSNISETKAATAGDDARIHTAQVLVFDHENGICEAYGMAQLEGKAGAVDVARVRTGRMFDCYAVANYPGSLQTVTSIAELRTLETELKNYAPDALPMTGVATKSFSSGEKTLDIRLERAAAKIEVKQISGAFTSPYYKQAASYVSAIYLYKAPGKYTLGLTAPTAQTYYHKDGYSTADARTLGQAAPLIGDTSLRGTTTGNTSYTTPHYFWCCPDEAGQTYLTIELMLDGKANYYGIPLGALAANCCYSFTDIRIYGPGADTPPGIVERVSISAHLTVSDWRSGYVKEYEF